MLFVQEKSPTAVVHAYKTTIPPLLRDCQARDGGFEAASMGKRAHVLALNAVSRHLAGVQARSRGTLWFRSKRIKELC